MAMAGNASPLAASGCDPALLQEHQEPPSHMERWMEPPMLLSPRLPTILLTEIHHARLDICTACGHFLCFHLRKRVMVILGFRPQSRSIESRNFIFSHSK